LAGGDQDRYPAVLKWKIREGLLAYSDLLADDALETHRWNCLYHAVGGGKKPETPFILKLRGMNG